MISILQLLLLFALNLTNQVFAFQNPEKAGFLPDLAVFRVVDDYYFAI